MSNKQQTILVKNVTLNWVKFGEPIDNFTGDKKIWEVQCSVPKERAAELEQFRKVRPVKDNANMVCNNLSKNAFLRNGDPAQPIRVVGKTKDENGKWNVIDPNTIGNGSIGTIMVMQDEYEILHPKTKAVIKSGTSSMLVSVQITNLIKYEAKNRTDFEDESDDTETDDQF
jgi:hypothetical protein